MARALGNLIGNCVATVVVAAWEGDLDRARAVRVLDGEELVDVTAVRACIADCSAATPMPTRERRSRNKKSRNKRSGT